MLVADYHQRRGVGTLLLEHLAAVARQAGIRSFVADTLAENGLMQQVFTDAGFPVERRSEFDVTHVVMSLAPTPAAQDAVDLRERSADVASLRHVLAPRSSSSWARATGPARSAAPCCATSSRRTSPVILRAVNPNRRWVQRLRAYPSVVSLPEPVDLAIVAVPGAAVEQVIRDCGERGIPAAVILSAGFGETDTDGADRERRLLRTARAAGVRLVGPNCLGVAVPDRRRAAQRHVRRRPRRRPARSASPPSPVRWASACWPRPRTGAIGVSGFVSLGNKLDVSGNDLLLYWEDDPATKVDRALPRVVRQPGEVPPARRAGSPGRKPIVALEGRSHRGRRPWRRLAHRGGRDARTWWSRRCCGRRA